MCKYLYTAHNTEILQPQNEYNMWVTTRRGGDREKHTALHDFILFLALEYLDSHTLKACDVFITGDFENI